MSALGIALLSIGLLVLGGGIGFYLARLGQSAETAKLAEVETEFEDYRRQVTEHFSKTADQFHAIGLQYRDLYEHLASGSETLCKLDSPAAEPPFPLVSRAHAERPAADEAEAVSEEVLVAAAAVSTAAVAEEEVETPVEETVADDGEDVAVAAADVEEIVLEGDAEDVVPEGNAEQVVEEDDEEAPDNVVELIPRSDAEDDDGSDGERSIR